MGGELGGMARQRMARKQRLEAAGSRQIQRFLDDLDSAYLETVADPKYQSQLARIRSEITSVVRVDIDSLDRDMGGRGGRGGAAAATSAARGAGVRGTGGGVAVGARAGIGLNADVPAAMQRHWSVTLSNRRSVVTVRKDVDWELQPGSLGDSSTSATSATSASTCTVGTTMKARLNRRRDGACRSRDLRPFTVEFEDIQALKSQSNSVGRGTVSMTRSDITAFGGSPLARLEGFVCDDSESNIFRDLDPVVLNLTPLKKKGKKGKKGKKVKYRV